MIQSVRSKRKRKDSDDEGEAAEVSQRRISTDFAWSYLWNIQINSLLSYITVCFHLHVKTHTLRCYVC